MSAQRYRSSYRRLLVDMHIPDWDDRFLARYKPAATVAAAADAGATALMSYFQSHVGLCYWPTESGQQHHAFIGTDPMAETMTAAAKFELPVCGYYSVNFNNWAYLNHTEWRMVPAATGMIGGGLLQSARYGVCCPNNADYRRFLHSQVGEIVGGYAIDALFFDMVWWMSLCICDSCRDLYEAEIGASLPTTINWFDADWCRFQAKREEWIARLATELRGCAKQIRPDLDVYHNFALGLCNWTRGISFESATGHDFLGGDFYGGRNEQLAISRLMLNLSAARPVEFMTTVATNLSEHEQLKSPEQLQTECLASTASSSAFLLIASVDPDGQLSPGMFERIRETFELAAPFEPYLGGIPVEDVGVYFSDASKMSFSDCHRSLADAPIDTPTAFPHLAAAQGACRALQRAHLPFGVITRKQLGELGDFGVVILPSVLRMDADEVDAFRSFVQAGGSLYASGCTSLTMNDGVRCGNFMLADIFGCGFQSMEDGLMVYAEPTERACRATIRPQRMLSRRIDKNTFVPRLRENVAGAALAQLVLPTGYPGTGSVDSETWSSIHSFPPQEYCDNPMIVENYAGSGHSIYSAIDFESLTSTLHDAMFVSLIQRLVKSQWTFEADCHPNVWITMFDQPEHSRYVVSCLHYPLEYPANPVPIFRLRLRPLAERSVNRVVSIPDESVLEFSDYDDGSIGVSISDLVQFKMLAIYYG